MEQNPWTTLAAEVKYDNPWINVTEFQVLNPAGNPGIYGKVHFKNIAIGVLPLDEDNNTWLVGQYRYVLDAYSWEIPEGGCPIGKEDPLECAMRELEEETGIKAKIYEKILTLHNSNSVSDEIAYIYVAKGLTFGEAMPEETEDLRVKKVHLSEALQMVLRGEITDAMTVAAILAASR